MNTANRHGISRIVLVYREENFDAALTAFATTLGITDFGNPFVPPGMGLRVAVSWDSGIELIAPHGEEGYANAMRGIIAARGEGFLEIVYRIPDLDEGTARAIAAGCPPRAERIDCFSANPAWRDRFTLAMEAPIAPIAGIDVTLIQLDPVP